MAWYWAIQEDPALSANGHLASLTACLEAALWEQVGVCSLGEAPVYSGSWEGKGGLWEGDPTGPQEAVSPVRRWGLTLSCLLLTAFSSAQALGLHLWMHVCEC